MAPLIITQAEILEALAKAASDAPEGAATVAELAEASGVGVQRVRKALKSIQAQGRLRIDRQPRQTLDGRTVLAAVYSVIPAPPTKRK